MSVLASVGLAAYVNGTFTQGLKQLSTELESLGYGDILDVLTATCWHRDDCPHCAIHVRYHGSTVAAGVDSTGRDARGARVESTPPGTAEPPTAADPRCGWG